MARGFGATLGAGSTDKVSTATVGAGTARSIGVWANRNGAGGNSLGRLWDRGPNLDFCNLSTSTYSIGRGFTGGTKSGNITAPSTGVWAHLLIVDDGSPTNAPVVYLNGASVTYTPAATTTGTPNGTLAFNLGNRADGTRNWDGLLAEFAIWDRALSADEAVALGKGISPLNLRSGLVEYVPLLRDNVSLIQAPPTIVGTAIQPHVSIIYPSSSLLILSGGGAGGLTLTPPLLTNTSTLYAPTVTPGAVQVSPPLIDSAAQLFGPTLTPGGVGLAPSLLTNTPVLYEPTISAGGLALAPPLIDSAAQIFGPTLTPGAVSLLVALLTNVPTLYAPTVTQGVVLALPMVESVAQLFAPVLTIGGVSLLVPQIASVSLLYAPSLSGSGVSMAAISAAASDAAYGTATASDSEG